LYFFVSHHSFSDAAAALRDWEPSCRNLMLSTLYVPAAGLTAAAATAAAESWSDPAHAKQKKAKGGSNKDGINGSNGVGGASGKKALLRGDAKAVQARAAAAAAEKLNIGIGAAVAAVVDSARDLSRRRAAFEAWEQSTPVVDIPTAKAAHETDMRYVVRVLL
jgi:hypothetical protein